jgi:hypothetical protein
VSVILKRSSSAGANRVIATAISLLGTPFRRNVCDQRIGMIAASPRSARTLRNSRWYTGNSVVTTALRAAVVLVSFNMRLALVNTGPEYVLESLSLPLSRPHPTETQFVRSWCFRPPPYPSDTHTRPEFAGAVVSSTDRP